MTQKVRHCCRELIGCALDATAVEVVFELFPHAPFRFDRAQREYPCLSRNRAKYKRHWLKRSLRRALGMREWSDAKLATRSIDME